MLLLVLVRVLLLPESSLSLAQEACDRTIGSNVQMELSNSETMGYQIYLNTAEPARCNGNITSVGYCYYGPSQYNGIPVWAAAVGLYRPEVNGSFRRVSDGLLLSKWTPNNRSSVSPENSLLLGFNCDTYILDTEDALYVQEGDMFGALVFADQRFLGLGGLDLVGDSSSGYQMMIKSFDGFRDFIDTEDLDQQLPETLNGLSLDIEKRVLHVFADIKSDPSIISPSSISITRVRSTTPRGDITATFTKSTNQPQITTIDVSNPSIISPTGPSITRVRSTTLRGDVNAPFTNNPYSTNSPQTSTKDEQSVTENETQDADFTKSSTQLQNSPQQIIVICGVLGAIVIVAVLIGIAIVIAVLHRRVSKQSQVSAKPVVNLQHPPIIGSALFALDNMKIGSSGNTQAEDYLNPISQRESILATQLNEYATVGPNNSKAKHGTMAGDHFYFVLDPFYFVLEGPKCPYSELLEKNKAEDIYEHVAKYHEPAKQERDLYAQIKSFGIRHIDRDSIQIQNHLGSGQFGSVRSGIWKTKKSEVKVAVKSLSQGISDETRVKFLQEAAIMAQFKHPNVAFLFGVVIEGEPIMLVVELVEKGDLKEYLVSIKSNPGEVSSDDLPSLLLSFSQHVALGMQYLSGKGFVHRDLAARNILVSKDNICKVADFGMSRDLADETYYVSHGGMIPVKWTAPEAIHYKKYSTASDVWSYGCLLYEIWSLALKPFENTSNFEVIRMLDEGVRLAPPPGCPRMIYELMIQCWHPITGSRPNFRELVLALTGDKSEVLLIPQGDGDTHGLARVLGSQLEAGKNMYKDLQNKYIV